MKLLPIKINQNQKLKQHFLPPTPPASTRLCLFPVLNYLHTDFVFITSSHNFFNLWPLPLVLPPHISVKRLALSVTFFTPWETALLFSQSLLFSSLNKPGPLAFPHSASAPAPNYLGVFPRNSLQVINILLVLVNPKLDAVFLMQLMSAK